MRRKLKFSADGLAMTLTTVLILAWFAAPAAQAASEISNPTVEAASVLDARRRFALGMIETANNDNEIGGAGEVSRYQIMLSVWKHYEASRRYQDPEVSLAVAQRHWSKLYSEFKKQTQREPSNFDMYVLWNTRYGYYASKGFKPARLNSVVRDRAQRFVNLMHRQDSQAVKGDAKKV